MVQIYFRSQDEYAYFKQLIAHKDIILNEKKKQGGLTVHINHLPDEQLIQYFTKVYIRFHIQMQTKKIIHEKYFYTNEEDIDHIVEWTNWLLQEPSFIEKQFNKPSLFDYLLALLLNQFRQMPIVREYIYFDTFILFQLKSFHNELVDVVGYAIDEMKREEDYQHYIESVRYYITNRQPKCSIIHVLDGEDLQLYSSDGIKYTSQYLFKLMKKEPLYIIGLDEYEKTIAPIITLLPQIIYIYSDDPDEVNTSVILNVFQERAKSLSSKKFPF